MRFTFVTVVVAALAGSALSAPTGAAKRSLVNQVGSVVGGLENGLPVGQVEQELQGLLGGSLGSIEGALGGLPLADKLLSLVQGGNLSGSALTTVGEALAMVKQGTPIDSVNSYLDAATGGVVSNLEETLGVQNIAGLVTGLVGSIL